MSESVRSEDCTNEIEIENENEIEIEIRALEFALRGFQSDYFVSVGPKSEKRKFLSEAKREREGGEGGRQTAANWRNFCGKALFVAADLVVGKYQRVVSAAKCC